MSSRLVFILTVLLLLCCVPSIGQQSKLLDSKQMKKDLKEILRTLEAHPDPYTKITEESFNQLVDEVQQNISQEMSILDFYKELSGLIAALEDGHSTLYMPMHWLKDTRKENGALPLEVFLDSEDDLYVVKSFGETLVPPGTRIHSINGLSIDDFIDKIDPIVSYELKQFRNVKVELKFEFYLYMVFGSLKDLTFTYFKNSEEIEVKIPCMPYKLWRKYQVDDREDRDNKLSKGEPYDFEILQPGVGLIKIYSFTVKNLSGYNIFLERTFKMIKKEKVHSLIIDVRGNFGGWPKMSSELFHYIHDGHFKTVAHTSMKVSEPYKNKFKELLRVLNDTRVGFYHIPKDIHTVDIEAILKEESGTFVDKEAEYNEQPITEGFEFSGDSYLLIDRKSFSAASTFAATFQCYDMGPVIGEPTGGTKVFRANSLHSTLPKSRFVLSMSTTKIFATCYSGEDEAVYPTIEAKTTVLDRVHDSDSQLNFALMLIRKIQKQRKATNEAK